MSMATATSVGSCFVCHFCTHVRLKGRLRLLRWTVTLSACRTNMEGVRSRLPAKWSQNTNTTWQHQELGHSLWSQASGYPSANIWGMKTGVAFERERAVLGLYYNCQRLSSDHTLVSLFQTTSVDGMTVPFRLTELGWSGRPYMVNRCSTALLRPSKPECFTILVNLFCRG